LFYPLTSEQNKKISNDLMQRREPVIS
jgi:hypothetical protein